MGEVERTGWENVLRNLERLSHGKGEDEHHRAITAVGLCHRIPSVRRTGEASKTSSSRFPKEFYVFDGPYWSLEISHQKEALFQPRKLHLPPAALCKVILCLLRPEK